MVIVPAHTYIASAFGVELSGATAVFCDVDSRTGLIDLDAASAVLSDRSAAVLPVHLYGQVCPARALKDFASKHNLVLIEDAAQAHGAESEDSRAGTIGEASAFSLTRRRTLAHSGTGAWFALMTLISLAEPAVFGI